MVCCLVDFIKRRNWRVSDVIKFLCIVKSNATITLYDAEAFIPTDVFYNETIDYFDLQRLGGLKSHLFNEHKGKVLCCRICSANKQLREILAGRDINYKSHQMNLAYFGHSAAFAPFLLKDKVKRGGTWHNIPLYTAHKMQLLGIPLYTAPAHKMRWYLRLLGTSDYLVW